MFRNSSFTDYQLNIISIFSFFIRIFSAVGIGFSVDAIDKQANVNSISVYNTTKMVYDMPISFALVNLRKPLSHLWTPINKMRMRYINSEKKFFIQ